MKKLIFLSLIFFLTTSFLGGQKPDYINSAKKDTLTISMILTDKQAPIVTTLQADLAKSVENQSKVSGNLTDVLSSLNGGIIAFTKEIEKRNKSDSMLINEYFNYSNEDVRQAIRRNQLVSALSWFLFIVYAFTVYYNIRSPNYNHTASWWVLAMVKYSIISVLLFTTVKILGSLIFNPDYFVIIKILTVYN